MHEQKDEHLEVREGAGLILAASLKNLRATARKSGKFAGLRIGW
jgi:hypothetical protein